VKAQIIIVIGGMSIHLTASAPVSENLGAGEHLACRMISADLNLNLWAESASAFAEGLAFTTFPAGIV
jgi:hypothetical protein